MENSAEHSMETPKTVAWRQSLRQKLLSSFSGWRVPLLIFLLALTLKIWSMDPISNWDESWLGDIAAIMAERGNWLYPLYSGEGGLKLFDKPPLVFWIVGSFISVFGRSTIAVKLPLAIGSACSALAGYLFFSHFKKSRLIGVFVGILMAVAFFYNFYARTAYLDAFIYGLSALLGVVSIKAIDAHYKEDDYKKTVVYLILTLLMLTMNILAKAWQGFLVLPAVAFYLFIRHLGSIYEWESYSQILNEVKTRWLTHHLRMERTINSLVSGIVAFFIGVVIQVPIQLSFLVAMGLSLGTFAFGSVLKIDARSMSTKESSQKVSDDLDSNPQESEVDSESEHDAPELNSLSVLGSPIFVKMVLVSLINGLFLGGIFQLISKILYSRFERPVFEILPNAGIELQVLILTDPLMVSTILSAILGLPLILLGFMLSGFFFLGMLSLLNVEPRCRHVILDLFKLIPFLGVGGWLGTWTVFFLLGGFLFNRDAVSITIVGVLGFLLIMLFFVEIPRWILTQLDSGKWNVPSMRSFFESLLMLQRRGDKHTYFAAIFGILVVLSVFPFVAWIQHVDTEIVLPGKYEVRVPGELFKDPNRPDKLNYTWLFFDYYVGWRYTYGTTYDLYSQFRSAIGDPILLLTFPFFLVGLYFYFFGRKEEREIAQGTFFVTWLFTILFFFLPAMFQLNYYYLGIFLPYFGIVGKGIHVCINSGTRHLTIQDRLEEVMLISPLVLLVFLTEIPDAVLSYMVFSFSLENFIFDDGVWRFVIFTVLYYLGVRKYIRDIPSIFTYGATLLYILWFNVRLDWLAFYIRAMLPFTAIDFNQIQLRLDLIYWLGDPLLTIFGVIILMGILLIIKTRITVGGFILLLLVAFAGISTVSGNVAVNDIFNGQFENIAHFILEHGGDYNYSTWVFPDAGVTGAMRFYLGYEVLQGHGNHPFATNDTNAVNRYFNENQPQVAFWVVANRSHGSTQATSTYTAAYRWLKENMVLADDEVGLHPDGTFHFFYNATKVQQLMKSKNAKTLHAFNESWKQGSLNSLNQVTTYLVSKVRSETGMERKKKY